MSRDLTLTAIPAKKDKPSYPIGWWAADNAEALSDFLNIKAYEPTKKSKEELYSLVNNLNLITMIEDESKIDDALDLVYLHTSIIVPDKRIIQYIANTLSFAIIGQFDVEFEFEYSC